MEGRFSAAGLLARVAECAGIVDEKTQGMLRKNAGPDEAAGYKLAHVSRLERLAGPAVQFLLSYVCHLQAQRIQRARCPPPALNLPDYRLKTRVIGYVTEFRGHPALDSDECGQIGRQSLGHHNRRSQACAHKPRHRRHGPDSTSDGAVRFAFFDHRLLRSIWHWILPLVSPLFQPTESK
jgi:hypothetical protein